MTTHLHPTQTGRSPAPEGPGEDPHRWLHSQTGPRPGEHPGRASNPPALAADAAVRAVTEALAAAGLPDARATAAHKDGRLVITVTGADPGRVRAAAGFALTVRSGPPPALQTAAH
jgi:hypothetical protein